MSGLVYKQYKSHTFTDVWGKLSQKEQEALLAKLDDALRQAGGKRIIVIDCDAAYGLKEWQTFGIEVFLDEEAMQRHTQLLDDLDWSSMVETECVIGSDLASLGLRAALERRRSDTQG
jgi:hypothetical protein